MKEASLDYQQKIIQHEEQLLNAFSTKDIQALEELIHADAVFVLPNGLTVNKTTVVDNYRNGTTSMNITASDQKITFIDDTAVVSVILELKGKYIEQEIRSQYQYLRVWKLVHHTWKVITTSGVPLNN